MFLQSLLKDGSTIAPVIIATDKTQLTQFSGGKKAYPVYLTIGNIPKSLRRKPSQRACILIAYLPVESQLQATGMSETERKNRTQRLFHEAMRLILEPLIKAGKDGVEMVGANGEVRKVHPLLACYAADFPEQCLVTCTKYGTCPKCRKRANNLQDPEPGEPRPSNWTLGVIESAKKTPSQASFYRSCMDNDVSGSVYQPFWKDFPYCDIHMATTPDILHQLYQGVITHLIDWVKTLMTEEEFDKRLKALPPAFGVRHFSNGWSSLSQISGTERKHMAKILLGCLTGKLAKEGIMAVKAILDFAYLAQYRSHSDETLAYLKEALESFHKHKVFFIRMGVRKHINIPKFHSLIHYIEAIKLFGATDNYNTETFERFHIDFAKEGWRASNKRDEFPQMITWLSRQEKISLFDTYLGMLDNHLNPEPPAPPTQLSQQRKHKIAKFPPFPSKRLQTIQYQHQAPNFSNDLKGYLNNLVPQPASNRHLSLFILPFQRIDVFSQFKFHPHNLLDLIAEEEEEDVVKALPISKQNPLGQFDTVVVLNNKKEDSESTGLTGKLHYRCSTINFQTSYKFNRHSNR